MRRMTYGLELEVGDVPRRLKIPLHLGKWDPCERDIVNSNAPYRGIAADPWGVKPPVGGEIQVVPGKSPEELADKVRDLLGRMVNPTAPPTAHVHVHVRVKGLRNDLGALWRLMGWLYHNQEEIFRRVGQFKKDPRMSRLAHRYLKFDGARRIPDWLVCRTMKAETFEEFMGFFRKGVDGIKNFRPVRYGINIYCMLHMDTIEFRFFRASICPKQILSCVEFCRRLLVAGLSSYKPVSKVFDSGDWDFPPFVYDHELVHGWEATRWPESRSGRKVRTLHDI